MTTEVAPAPQIEMDDIVTYVFAEIDNLPENEVNQAICEQIIAIRNETDLPEDVKDQSARVIMTSDRSLQEVQKAIAKAKQPNNIAECTVNTINQILHSLQIRHSNYQAALRNDEIDTVYGPNTPKARWFDLLHWCINIFTFTNPYTIKLLKACPKHYFEGFIGRELSNLFVANILLKDGLELSQLTAARKLLETCPPLKTSLQTNLSASTMQQVGTALLKQAEGMTAAVNESEDLEANLENLDFLSEYIKLLKLVESAENYDSEYHLNIEKPLNTCTETLAKKSLEQHDFASIGASSDRLAAAVKLNKYISSDVSRQYSEKMRMADFGQFCHQVINADPYLKETALEQFEMATYLNQFSYSGNNRAQLACTYDFTYRAAAVAETAHLELPEAVELIKGSPDHSFLGHRMATSDDSATTKSFSTVVRDAITERVDLEVEKWRNGKPNLEKLEQFIDENNTGPFNLNKFIELLNQWQSAEQTAKEQQLPGLGEV